MSHPGVAEYTTKVCGNQGGYVRNLIRSARLEKVEVRLVFEDLKPGPLNPIVQNWRKKTPK